VAPCAPMRRGCEELHSECVDEKIGRALLNLCDVVALRGAARRSLDGIDRHQSRRVESSSTQKRCSDRSDCDEHNRRSNHMQEREVLLP